MTQIVGGQNLGPHLSLTYRCTLRADYPPVGDLRLDHPPVERLRLQGRAVAFRTLALEQWGLQLQVRVKREASALGLAPALALVLVQAPAQALAPR